ncbi:hypothetical protein Asppvi_011376 [Aspergillus pseudoviridinutans]|uniref:FAD/NAD(P)-binding domain-containing protein n=1 Tax=Aspergillus pseudoviridinutans TaxID=1517512 RepID=A0A9P3EXU5_9EURO|nr:uncharacterized protein Asppvi_011376 [Aspergillus pseudoviridinutans]GIJ92394.1 hypothetical protein Asppvi_011376 [Aspergillus pseudoviridinutans]
MASTTSRVVVIGGSNAGIGVCHGLLQQIPDISVTLVNPSKEYYFNLAAPRFLAKSGLLPSSKYIYSITDVFSKYPCDRFRFLQGKATAIDLKGQYVCVDNLTSSPLPYDYLVIASGSTTPAAVGRESFPAPFKVPLEGDLSAAIQRTQAAVDSAKTIIIGGAGPTGVEFAGEIAEAYGHDGAQKKITLVSGTDTVLAGLTPGVQDAAARLLRSKGVDLKTSSRVRKAEYNLKTKQWVVTLSAGEVLTADLFISAMGSVPNNDFIPQSLLNQEGWVDVDEHLRAKAPQRGAVPNVYALGDITSFTDRLLLRIKPQVKTVVANLKKDLTGEGSVSVYRPGDQIRVMVIPVGRYTGTGLLGNWKMCGFMVSFFKGRDFLTSKAASFIEG